MMLRLGVNEVIVSYNLLAAKEGVGHSKALSEAYGHMNRDVLVKDLLLLAE